METNNILKLLLILSIPIIVFLPLKNKISNRQIYKLFTVIILTLYLSFTLLIPAIWCYNPSILLNTKYEIISKEKIEDFKETSLFISDHHINNLDQMIMLTEIIKSSKKFNIVSLKYNFITNLFKSLPLFSAYDLIHIDKNKKNDVVKKCVEKLKEKQENVLFFMKENAFKRKGIYHVLQETNVPIVLVRFKELQTGNKVFNRKFEIEYEKIENYKLTEDKELFMNSIKEKLYPSETSK